MNDIVSLALGAPDSMLYLFTSGNGDYNRNWFSSGFLEAAIISVQEKKNISPEKRIAEPPKAICQPSVKSHTC